MTTPNPPKAPSTEPREDAIELLRAYQSWLGASRDRCGGSVERNTWDRIERAIADLTTPRPDVQADEVSAMLEHWLGCWADKIPNGAYYSLLAVQKLATQPKPAPEAQGEETEDEYVIRQLSTLLAKIAVIVNGPEPPLTRWSYHDLPAKVAAIAANSQAVANEMAAWAEKRLSGPHDNRTVRRLVSGWAERLHIAALTRPEPDAKAGEDTAWNCAACGQLNSHWATECGRCDAARAAQGDTHDR